MILNELRNYIEEQGSANRHTLAKKFALSQDGIDAMLALWVKKGKLSRIVDLDKHGEIWQVRYRSVKSSEISMTVIS